MATKKNGNGSDHGSSGISLEGMFDFITKQKEFNTLIISLRKALKADKDSLDDPTRVVTYFSKSHDKRRYFTSLFSDKPDHEQKVQFSYDSKEGTLVSRKTGMLVIKVLGKVGYEGLNLSAP